MYKLERSQRFLLAYSSFVALGSLFVLVWILSSPSEPANAILFGFSAPRLAMVIGLIGVLIFYAGIGFNTIKDRGWSSRFVEKWFQGKGISQGIMWLSVISFGFGWIKTSGPYLACLLKWIH